MSVTTGEQKVLAIILSELSSEDNNPIILDTAERIIGRLVSLGFLSIERGSYHTYDVYSEKYGYMTFDWEGDTR